VTGNLSNFSTSLSYTPTEVRLNLTAALGLGGNLNPNQQNVANAINGYFNGGGTLPRVSARCSAYPDSRSQIP
jgi:hypothetical protein